MTDDYIFEYLHMEIVQRFCEHEERDGNLNEAIQKLEKLGFFVGQKLIERETKDKPRFKDELDTMKFICKEIWVLVYKKQLDNLRTNHHGVYNLLDNKFRILEQMSSDGQYKEHVPKVSSWCRFASPKKYQMLLRGTSI